MSKRVFQENKPCQIFRKTNISDPQIRTRTYVCVSGGKKCSFFGKFGVLCFLETLILRFALLRYYRKTANLKAKIVKQSLIGFDKIENKKNQPNKKTWLFSALDWSNKVLWTTTTRQSLHRWKVGNAIFSELFSF